MFIVLGWCLFSGCVTGSSRGGGWIFLVCFLGNVFKDGRISGKGDSQEEVLEVLVTDSTTFILAFNK